MEGARVKIFLLDDHELLRRGIRDALDLEADLEVVGEASTARDALPRIAATSPDVAVLDVSLPDGNGVEICREIRSRYPSVACLMLSATANDEAVFGAIVAGAAGFVLKGSSAAQVIEAVRQVAAGQSLLDPSLTGLVLERVRAGPQEDKRLSRLTRQERRILSLLAEGLTNRQIAERIHLAEKTVRNYVSAILEKLGMERRTQAALFSARLEDGPGKPRA
jgi:DNA-binding NarL/FixJ family response regulator